MEQNELSKELINGFRSWVESEKQFVLLIIGFNLTISSLVLSEKVFAVTPKSGWIGVSVTLFLFSAGLYYRYYHALHLAVRQVLFSLESLDVSAAIKAQSKPWERWKYAAYVGGFCTFAGIGILVVRYFVGAKW